MILAVIFAGGQGRRLGHVDKALLDLNGRTLIDHVKDRLAGQVDHIVINANGERTRFTGPVVGDDPASHLDGPFRALETAFRIFAGERTATQLLHVPTDTPFLPMDLVARLGSQKAPAAFPVTHGQAHPVLCLWSRAGATAASERLKTYNGERLADFILACGGVTVDFDDQGPAFFNINRPEDLVRASQA